MYKTKNDNAYATLKWAVYTGPDLTHRKQKPSTSPVFSGWGRLNQREDQREREREMEEEDERGEPDPKKKKVMIKIPSYQEVIESSQSKSTPPSLFTPSQSFSQAFSFVKSSEFYSPPPPPQPPQVSQTTFSRYPFCSFLSKPHK